MAEILRDAFIFNVSVIDPEKKSTTKQNVLIRGGILERLMPPTENADGFDAGAGIPVIDGTDRYLSPSFVDVHTHLRDPGFEYKEDVITATAAAAEGGFGAVTAMPNTRPTADNPETIKYVLDKAKESGSCTVFCTGSITEGLKSKALCNYDKLTKAGAIAFTDDGMPVIDTGMMHEAMVLCAKEDYLIISHSEELSLTGDGVINAGPTAEALGVPGIPTTSELLAVARDALLAKETGCRLHLAHLSTKESVNVLRFAKKVGAKVTGETCPHYFALCDEDVRKFGVIAKMKPPLRSREDVEAIIEGLCDGTIDCISTDHAPHATSEKANLISGAFGIIGLQSAFPLAYEKLVLTGRITLERLIELMSYNPAKIIGADKYGFGVIREGGPAELVLFSLGTDYRFGRDIIKSKSVNTPFVGMRFKSRADILFRGPEF